MAEGGGYSEASKRMMEKMGWKEGRGLGKGEKGRVGPIRVEKKDDRRGLDERKKKASEEFRTGWVGSEYKGKQPTQQLTELADRMKLTTQTHPQYRQSWEGGPEHCRRYKFQTVFAGRISEGKEPSTSKKAAKAEAAKSMLWEIEKDNRRYDKEREEENRREERRRRR